MSDGMGMMDLCESAPAKSSFDRIMVKNEGEGACSMGMNDDSNDLQRRLAALMDEPVPKSRGIAMEEESKAASLPTPAPAKAAPPKQAVPAAREHVPAVAGAVTPR